MLTNKVFETEDGSNSILSGKFGEAYHSRHGALQESQHVFIAAGLEHLLSKNIPIINILEIGFGTGLNAILTYLHVDNLPNTTIDYHGIEAYPISKDDAQLLNYDKVIGTSADTILQFHTLPWGEPHPLSTNFKLTKHLIKFEDFESTSNFDLIYFDAFAPSIQNHLWEVPFLQKIFDLCNDDAVLVTYCAKGSFKRALKECGFSLEPLPGPAKKREMTRAIK